MSGYGFGWRETLYGGADAVPMNSWPWLWDGEVGMERSCRAVWSAPPLRWRLGGFPALLARAASILRRQRLGSTQARARIGIVLATPIVVCNDDDDERRRRRTTTTTMMMMMIIMMMIIIMMIMLIFFSAQAITNVTLEEDGDDS
eukprot:5033000-Amphidinium_carterae.1